MMKLVKLLDQHRLFESHGLPGSFGDGYLVAHNEVFRRIREAALAEGYRFSDARDEAYENFPLLQLEDLLKKKTLPYSNNMSALRTLSVLQAEALHWSDLDGNLKKNFVFHEACHGVARNLADKLFVTVSPGAEINSERRFVARILLEESCANACELLGCIEAADLTHRIFYEMNSYICEFERRRDFQNAISEMGSEIIGKWMILSYLQSNFLRSRLDESDFRVMLEITGAGGLSPTQLKTLRALSKVAFQLSERFREQTTAFHLRLAGIRRPIVELLDFDVLTHLRGERGFSEFLSTISATLTGTKS